MMRALSGGSELNSNTTSSGLPVSEQLTKKEASSSTSQFSVQINMKQRQLHFEYFK